MNRNYLRSGIESFINTFLLDTLINKTEFETGQENNLLYIIYIIIYISITHVRPVYKLNKTKN